MKGTVSILGLYKWDENLFNHLNIPAELDRDIVVNNLLSECAELECIYYDPEYMEFMIDVWSAKELPIWEHLYNTTQYAYIPIYNYYMNGKDLTTNNLKEYVERALKENGIKTNNLLREYGGKDILINAYDSTIKDMKTGTEKVESEHKVAAFNNDTIKTEHTDSSTTTYDITNTTKHTGNDTATSNYGQTISDKGNVKNDIDYGGNQTTTNTGDVQLETKREGSTGIYSIQELIKQEREIAQFNVIDYIIDSFKRRFCLGVY